MRIVLVLTAIIFGQSALGGGPPPSMHISPELDRLIPVGNLHYRISIGADGVALSWFDRDGNPTSVTGARGVVWAKSDDSPKRIRYDLFPKSYRGAGSHLLQQVIAPTEPFSGAVTLHFQIIGLPDQPSRRLEFSHAMEIRKPDADKSLAEKPSRVRDSDLAAVKIQELCPVMEEPLDSMGGPWRVPANGKIVYVCCKGCISDVQKNPEQYLAKIESFKTK